MDSTKQQRGIIWSPNSAPAKKTTRKTTKKTGKTAVKKSTAKKPKIDKRDKKSSWVAAYVLYPESACLDADPSIPKKEAIYNAIANRTRHDLTGFISPLHDHDAQRSDYNDNDKLYPGAITMFIHLAGAAVSILDSEEKILKSAGVVLDSDEKKVLSHLSECSFANPLSKYSLVIKTLAFLGKDPRFIYDRTTIKTTMPYYIERFVDEVLVPAPARDWEELKKGIPDFFRSEESRVMVVEETSSDGKKKKKKVLPGESGYEDPDPEGLTWAHVPTYKIFQDHAYKKPHYHVVLINTGYKAISKRGWQKRGLRYWGDLSGGHVELVLSEVRSMYEYMTHESISAKNEYKHVYDSADLLELPGFTLEDYADISKEYRRTILGLAQDFGQVIYDLKLYGYRVYRTCDSGGSSSSPFVGWAAPDSIRPELPAYEQYTYIKSIENLEWYWGHSNLKGVCDNLADLIDEIEVQIARRRDRDLKRKKEKIEKVSERIDSDWFDEDMRELYEDLRKSFELECKTTVVQSAGDISVLENDKKRLAHIKKLIEEHRWPDEVELRRSALAYRNSYKDIYEAQRQLEREQSKNDDN